MTYYAIRQISTGWFLPTTRFNRGFTHTKPTEDCIPRLFDNKRGAVMALEWWLDGRYSSDEDGCIFRVREQHQPRDRDPNDMEIVEMSVLPVTRVDVHINVQTTSSFRPGDLPAGIENIPLSHFI